MKAFVYIAGLGALGFVIYRIYTLISNYQLAGLPGGLTDWASNIATGQLTAAQKQQIASDTVANVKKAGGSDQQAQDASMEVLNFIQYSAPFQQHWYSPSIPASTVIPCTGVDIYTLRKGGYTDDEIAGFMDQCAGADQLGMVTP